jgi:beta-phosphoglucomutase
MSLRACIFDLDGVLVDTARYHYLAWKRLAEQLNIKFTEEDNEHLKGVSRMDSLEIILNSANLKIDQKTKDEFADLKNRWYFEYIIRMTPDEILPGSLQLINELKKEGIKIALGSASRNTPIILERIKLENTFDAIADGNIVSRAKPDPEVFLTAAGMLNVNPEECIVIEDAIAGIRAAKSAGMRCIGIGSATILTEAHYVVSGLNKLDLKLLLKIYNSRLP